MSAYNPEQKTELESQSSSASPVPAYTASPIVGLLRKLLDHHIGLKDREEKALTCLRNAVCHIPDEKERQELSWIGPKGELRTPWTSAMEFFSLYDTGIEENTLREYLATFGVAGRLGLHPNTAITGNIAVVGRLVALSEAGFTAKLVEHLRQEFPDEIDAIVGPALNEVERGSVAQGPGPVGEGKKEESANTDSQSKKLRPCDERAYNQFLFATEQEASLKSDKEVYDWLSGCKSIQEDELPSFATWSRCLRRARNAKGKSKNTPRRGNPTKSVVRGHRVEYQQKKGFGEEDPDQ
jgi:hypothetical protein